MLSRINLVCEVSLALMTGFTQAAGWGDAGASPAERISCTVSADASAATGAPVPIAELKPDIHL